MKRHPALLALLVLSTPAASQQNVTGEDRTGYALQAGDVIRIDVWNRDDFSGQFQVNENGLLNYPAVGELDVRDLTIGSLRDSIRAGLSIIFNRPLVTITPLFRMAVIGHVRQPGLYTVDPTLTVFDMVALAGGPTTEGNLNSIKLLRGGEELELSFEEQAIRGRTLQELGVRSGDQIVVNRRTITRNDIFIGLQILQLAISIAILIRQ